MAFVNRIKPKLSLQEGLIKAQRYCSYQERCINELENKLKEWGVDYKYYNEIVDALVEDNFINEKRFAETYARGKFNIKGWGKLKISAELKRRSIENTYINNALSKIEQQSYRSKLVKLMEKKIKETGDLSNFHNRNKVLWYLVSKGYEKELILEEIRNLSK